MYQANNQQHRFYSTMASRNYKKIAFATLAAILAFIIGVLIGYFSWKNDIKAHEGARDDCDGSVAMSRINRPADPSITDKILSSIDVQHLDEVLRYLTRKPRLAGTKHQKEIADYLHRKNLQYGLTSEIVEYNVLLSYPKHGYNNTVRILDDNGNELFKSNPYEENLGYQWRDPEEVQAFNAFCPGGTVEGELIMFWYGERYEYRLAEEKGINMTGKVAMVRYGRMFRGNLVQNAEQAGAAGVIIFSDPRDYGPRGNRSAYPDTWFLPESGVQRGNVVLNKGDQATPGYPATEYAYRMSREKALQRMPKIPCQPISARDAKAIFSFKNENGTFNTLDENRKVKLEVHNELKEVPIYNVIGKITGDIEPDRYVVVGNHYDAWLYGASDPTSGTTIINEIARVFGLLYKNGWRPRRSILFCNWDAEEYGLVGSYEWVEDNMKWLKSKVVAYINSDAPISGNATLFHKGNPILNKVFTEAAKKIQDPTGREDTLFKSWKEDTGGKIRPLGGGSDHVPFVANAGIPSMYPKFIGSLNSRWYGTSTPLYHSRYETYHSQKMIDPEMKYSKVMAGLIAEIVRQLADSVIIPLDLDSYLKDIQDSVESMHNFLRSSHNITTDEKYYEGINDGVNLLAERVAEFKNHIETSNKNDPLLVRSINDKLMSLERALLDDQGLPDRPHFKNLLHSPGSVNYYRSGISFPGIQSLATEYWKSASPDTQEEVMDRIHEHMSVIAYSIHSAAKILEM